MRSYIQKSDFCSYPCLFTRQSFKMPCGFDITTFFLSPRNLKRHYARNPGGLRNHYVAFLWNIHGMIDPTNPSACHYKPCLLGIEHSLHCGTPLHRTHETDIKFFGCIAEITCPYGRMPLNSGVLKSNYQSALTVTFVAILENFFFQGCVQTWRKWNYSWVLWNKLRWSQRKVRR